VGRVTRTKVVIYTKLKMENQSLDSLNVISWRFPPHSQPGLHTRKHSLIEHESKMEPETFRSYKLQFLYANNAYNLPNISLINHEPDTVTLPGFLPYNHTQGDVKKEWESHNHRKGRVRSITPIANL